MKDRRLIAIMVLAAWFLLFTMVNQASAASHPKAPKLTIAASIDNIPFHFADEKGRAVGMFVDLWSLWASKTGREIEFIPRPWAQSLDMVRTGRADIHAGCFFSPQRDRYLDYAGELRDCQTHFFYHDTIYGLNTLQDLRGFHIGVLDKDYAVEFVRRELPDAALKLYDSHKALFRGVEQGDVKVFICDTPTALYFLARNGLIARFRYHPSSPLYRKPFFAAVQQGNPSLVQTINRGLASISPDERAAIERKWMGEAAAQPKDQLIVAVDQSFPPFSMRAANGEASGLWVDYWRAWADKNGKKVEIRLYDRADAVNALKDGIIDILATVPAQRDSLDWAGFASPYYRLDWYLFRPRTQKDGQADMGSMHIGALTHSKAMEWLRARTPAVPRISGFDTTSQMILALSQEKIDGIVATAQEMAIIPGQLGLAGDFSPDPVPLFQSQVEPGVRNFNPGLIQRIESGFKRLHQAEKAAIESKWVADNRLRIFKTASAGLQLSEPEEEWLTAHKLSGLPIKFGIHTSLPPLEFIGENQSYQGMVSDVVSLLTERLGLHIQLIPDPGPSEADVIPGAFLSHTPDPAMANTRVYMSFPKVIITRTQAPLITGLMDMSGKTLACGTRGAVLEKLKSEWPAIRIKPVYSVEEGLNRVVSGRVDGYLENLALAGYQIQARNYTELKVAAAAAVGNSDLVFSVRKDWPELISILNKGIASITARELDQVRQKWFTVRFDQGTDLVFVQTMARRIAFGVLLVFGGVLFWNRMIRRREERFRCLTEHGTDIIQAFSPEGRLIYVSPSHASVLGYPLKQIKNKSVYDLIHPDDTPGFRRMLGRLMRTGGTDNRVYRIRHHKGHDLFFESHCMNLLQNKAIKAFVINGRDITDALKSREEIEQAREAAEAANQKKSDFLAGLSHEIRTPLNAILGMTEMTLNSGLGSAQSQNLAAVLSAARHLKAVISDILEFSTIEAGKMKVFQKNFRMDTLLENLTHIWQAEAAAKGLRFSLVKEGNMPIGVRSDPVRLNQILTNLLSNAVKFTPQGEITLTVAIANPPASRTKAASAEGAADPVTAFEPDSMTAEKRTLFVAFRVKDTGIGIDKTHLEKIFQRFTQAQGSITREYGGTGLGLSLCREMAKRLGGEITVESQPEIGSCFTLYLPLTVLPNIVEEQPRSDHDAAAVPRGLTLVLAEDDPVNQSVFKEMTAQFTPRVLLAADGRQVLEVLKANPADMVFMDVEMPKMDGLTAARRIREGGAGDRHRNIPIIAMTAHVLDEYRNRTKAAGMNEFIPKPIEHKDLINILKTYAPPQQTGCPVDREQALAAVGGSPDLLNKIYDIFISETPELTAALGAALEAGDPDAIALAAHTLKGAGARIYATSATEAAAALESLAKQTGPNPAAEEINASGRATLEAFEDTIIWLKKDRKTHEIHT